MGGWGEAENSFIRPKITTTWRQPEGYTHTSMLTHTHIPICRRIHPGPITDDSETYLRGQTYKHGQIRTCKHKTNVELIAQDFSLLTLVRLVTEET